MKYHPDKNPDDREVANVKFIRISEAYKRITDPDSFMNDEEGFEMDEETMNAIFEELFEGLLARRCNGKLDEMAFIDEDEQMPEDVMAMMHEIMGISTDVWSDIDDHDEHSDRGIMDEMIMLMNLMGNDSMGSKFGRDGFKKERMATEPKKLDLKGVTEKRKSPANEKTSSQEEYEDFSDESWESVICSDSESDETDLLDEGKKIALIEGSMQNEIRDNWSQFSNFYCHGDDSSVDFSSVCLDSRSCKKNRMKTFDELHSKNVDLYTSAPNREIPKIQLPTLDIGDMIDYRSKRGEIVFIGEVHYTTGVMIGVIMNDPVGKNDGFVKGQRYFECIPGHGLMVRPSELSLVGTTYRVSGV